MNTALHLFEIAQRTIGEAMQCRDAHKRMSLIGEAICLHQAAVALKKQHLAPPTPPVAREGAA